MKRIVPIKMRDGTIIYAEVDEPEIVAPEVAEPEIVEPASATRSEPQRVSRRLPDIQPAEVKQKFETAIETIKPAVDSIVSSLRAINNPSKINIELGINFSAKLGAVVASTSSDVAFKIAIEWDNSRDKHDDSAE